jgi:hypothetical protein
VPVDRDYEGVYREIAEVSQALVLTETGINIKIRFPQKDVALEAARRHTSQVSYAESFSLAVEMATAQAGKGGTVLIAAAQPIVGEAMMLWNQSFEVI